MATDPICGMTVDEKTARSAVRDGVTFFFCSEGCLRKFTGDAAPAATPPCCGSHRPAAKAPAGRADAIYTCPMHPEIEQVGPGSCPKCGMDLEPKTVQLDAGHDDPELRSMTRRFWIATALTLLSLPAMYAAWFRVGRQPTGHGVNVAS